MNSSLPYSLGLDMGSSSIGWFVLGLDANQQPTKIIDRGVRLFSTGRKPDKDKAPLALERRTNRSARRRRDRTLAAKRQLIHLLTAEGLLPADEDGIHAVTLLDPYHLRARGVREKLEPYEFGRALLHLRQRRGFKSNRIADKGRDEKEEGATKEGIKALHAELDGKTLGEYLHARKASGETVKFRPHSAGQGKVAYDFYPTREMYDIELKALWEEQAKHHSQLTDEFFEKVHRIIIGQRPLAKVKPGKCALLPEEDRIRAADPLAQRVRILQEVNQLRFEAYDDLSQKVLTEAERLLLIEHLTLQPGTKLKIPQSGVLVWSKIRGNLLKLEHDLTFSQETDARKGLQVDLTALALADESAFGSKWHKLSIDDQRDVVERIQTEEDHEALLEWLQETHALSAEQAEAAADARLVPGYARLSRKAMEAILPHLEKGLVYSDACAASGIDHARYHEGDLLEKLPYYGELLPDAVIGGDGDADKEKETEKFYGRITNPTVHNGLNQVRKLVNALIKEYGRPTRVVIELARELKHSPEEIKKMEKRRAENTRKNEDADEKLKKLNITVNYQNRLKLRIWNEQREENAIFAQCPFTGEQINVQRLFTPDVEVEHLLPWAQTFDNSPANKVVALQRANRVKGNRSPFEAFGHSPHGYDWEAVANRAQMLPKNKQWRFEADALVRFDAGEAGDEPSHLLNDTRYMSKVALRYLRYICPDVQASNGRLTSLLAKHWGLYKVIGDVEKQREDHRHHAIDAFAIACTSRSFIKKVSSYAASRRESDPFDALKLMKEVPDPWPDFSFDEFKRSILSIVVSHKPDHGNAQQAIQKGKTTGKLHEATNYGFIKKSAKAGNVVIAHRVELTSIQPKEKNINEVANAVIRKDLLEQYDSLMRQGLGGTEFGKQWLAFLEAYSRETGCRRVRLHQERSPDTLRSIMHGKDFYRAVPTGGNAFIDIFEYKDKRGKENWGGETTATFDAHQEDFKPNWKNEYPDAKLVMHLSISDMIALPDGEHWQLYVVRQIWTNTQIEFLDHRLTLQSDAQFTKKPSALYKLGAHKVSVDILGRAHPARFRPVVE